MAASRKTPERPAMDFSGRCPSSRRAAKSGRLPRAFFQNLDAQEGELVEEEEVTVVPGRNMNGTSCPWQSALRSLGWAPTVSLELQDSCGGPNLLSCSFACLSIAGSAHGRGGRRRDLLPAVKAVRQIQTLQLGIRNVVTHRYRFRDGEWKERGLGNSQLLRHRAGLSSFFLCWTRSCDAGRQLERSAT